MSQKELYLLTSYNLIDLVTVENLFFEKGGGQLMECVHIVDDDVLRLFVTLSDNGPDFSVDQPGCVFTVVPVLGKLLPKKICSSFLPQASGPIFSLIPHSHTIFLAISVDRSISLPAPVV